MDFEKDTAFFSGRLKSFKYAIAGAGKLLVTEHSVLAQFIIAIALVPVGFYCEISNTEWMFQILASGMVLSVEGLNTAIEKIADFIHPQYNEKIGFIKDVAAGAVLFAAVTAIAIGLMIYVPKFL